MFPKQSSQLFRRRDRFFSVRRIETVVVESNPIDDADKEQRPVGAAFSLVGVAAIIDGEEDVRCFGEIGKCILEGQGVGGLNKHEGHAGTEEDDIAEAIVGEIVAFQVPKEPGHRQPNAFCWNA